MPAITAWIHVPEEDLNHRYIPLGTGRDQDKHTGLARCYKLSAPVDFDGDGVPDQYVLVRVLFEREHMHPEIAIFPCDETGHIYHQYLRRRGGSMTLPKCPKDNEHALEFAIGVALSFHDISVVDSAPSEPEPPTEPQLPPGLDYDPDDLPDNSWYEKPSGTTS